MNERERDWEAAVRDPPSTTATEEKEAERKLNRDRNTEESAHKLWL